MNYYSITTFKGSLVFPQLAKHRDSAHPMREDVKQKHFSTPLREVVMGLASRPLVFVERV